jgi:hypothetical protein
MKDLKVIAINQPALDRLLAEVLASDNWGALMRRYVSAAKPHPTTENLTDAQLKDIGLTRANPEWIAEPRRYQGDL